MAKIAGDRCRPSCVSRMATWPPPRGILAFWDSRQSSGKVTLPDLASRVPVRFACRSGGRRLSEEAERDEDVPRERSDQAHQYPLRACQLPVPPTTMRLSMHLEDEGRASSQATSALGTARATIAAGGYGRAETEYRVLNRVTGTQRGCRMLTGDFAGQWWVPGTRRRLGGTLRLESGRHPTLHLMARLTKQPSPFTTAVVRHPVILGITALGQPVTLVDADEVGGNAHWLEPKIGDTVLRAARAYVGANYRDEGSATFRSLTLDLTRLSDWLPPPRIERDLKLSAGRLQRATLTFQPAADISVRMPFGSLTFGFDFSTSGDLRTAAQFQQSTRVVATCARRQSLAWWLTTVVRPLRFLLSLATEDPTFVEGIKLRRRPVADDDDVEVVWANDLGSGQPERDRNQLLFWQMDLADRFESAIADWFGAVAAVGHVLSQYVATLNTQRSYAETRFVMTAQAAEAYQRERLASSSTTRQRSPDAWLVNRLVGLCQSVPDVTQLMVGDDVRTFAESVRDARNLRTHLNADRDDHQQLMLLGAQLGVILEGAILHRELGFPSPLIAERVAAHSRLKALADAARARDVPTTE